MNIVTSSIPSTIPLNTPKTIQTPSSIVHSLLVSYAMLLISNSLKSCLFFTGWLSMKLFMIGIMLHMYVSIINTYGSYLKSIHHSYFYTHQLSLVAHSFRSVALNPHGIIEAFVFFVPYANVSYITEFYHPRIIS